MRLDSVAVVSTNQDILKHKKKRGKYVEKKTSKLSAHSKASSRTRNPNTACSPKGIVLPPPPTSFVNSVLDVLSRTTTQSQYLVDVPKAKTKKKMSSNKGRKNDGYPEKTPKKKTSIERKPAPKKNLQLKKQLDINPSTCSSVSRDGLSWMSYSDDEEVFINKEIVTEIPLKIDYENNQVVKEINEGKKLNEEKSRNEDANRVNNKEKGLDSTIYNFFVNVLHTIKPEYEMPIKEECKLIDSTDDLKNLEIDENVAKKLAITQKINMYDIEDELGDSPAGNFEIENQVPKRPIFFNPPVRLRQKSKSFAHAKPKQLPKSSSFARKSSNAKKTKKKRFLAMLRQQLLTNIEHSPQHFKEPQTLYEALKLMAKNKVPQPRVQFQKSKITRRRDVKPIKPRRQRAMYDVRYPIEAEVDSRFASIYGTGESIGSLQVFGEDYQLLINQQEYDNESDSSDLCNRFSITSFSRNGVRTKSSPVSVSRRTTGNRSASPFSGRSSIF